MHELVYLLYWHQGQLKIKKGRLGLNFVPEYPEGETGYPYHTKVPMKPMTLQNGKIICYKDTDIPKATEIMLQARYNYKKEMEKKLKNHCADCKYFEPIRFGGGRGECKNCCDSYGHHDVRYRSDVACMSFKQSNEPSTQYLRTKYDGILHCPWCKRNINWSDSLRRAYEKKIIADYISDRPTNQNIKVFHKICNNCGCDFEFFYDKLTEDYKYFTKIPGDITKNANINEFMEEKEMGPEELTLDFKLYYAYAPKAKEIKINGPATIIFWEDGDKTVVKHDGKGRKDKRMGILYAYIKKIYGPGKKYHEVLNQIEEALK